MRKILVVAASFGLAGCSSISMPSFSGFKSDPPAVTVQFESLPVGAEAKTTSGQTCKTPCSMSVPAADGFSVTFSAPKYQPETVPVLVVRQQPDASGSPDYAQGQSVSTIVDPNPVYAELKPAGPQKGGKAAPAKPAKPKKPKPSVAPQADDTAFPPPPSR
ncbi:MAG: hypothetical protein J0I29_06810 [Rhizobiales bacterium]|nr:hypothetical protein [Hyphomicrobiales bacterium]